MCPQSTNPALALVGSYCIGFRAGSGPVPRDILVHRAASATRCRWQSFPSQSRIRRPVEEWCETLEAAANCLVSRAWSPRRTSTWRFECHNNLFGHRNCPKRARTGVDATRTCRNPGGGCDCTRNELYPTTCSNPGIHPCLQSNFPRNIQPPLWKR